MNDETREWIVVGVLWAVILTFTGGPALIFNLIYHRHRLVGKA